MVKNDQSFGFFEWARNWVQAPLPAARVFPGNGSKLNLHKMGIITLPHYYCDTAGYPYCDKNVQRQPRVLLYPIWCYLSFLLTSNCVTYQCSLRVEFKVKIFLHTLQRHVPFSKHFKKDCLNHKVATTGLNVSNHYLHFWNCWSSFFFFFLLLT